MTYDPEEVTQPASFTVELGKQTVEIASLPNKIFSAFTLTVPAAAIGRDMVWYVNAPQSWSEWYILPAEGALKRGFKKWHNAQRLYRGIDQARESDRFRFFQDLAADYFEADQRYILWFARAKTEPPAVEQVRLKITFAESQTNWVVADMMKALAMESAPHADQIAALNSRGGRILLEPGWFKKSQAHHSIDRMLDGRESKYHNAAGFFIKTETQVPPCKIAPTMHQVRDQFGEPDFIRRADERDRIWRDADEAHQVDAQRLAGPVIMYYDYFGFEVSANDRNGKILRVHTVADDYRVLAPPPEGNSYATLPTENLTVFHQAGQECGRMYFFAESGKEPVVIQAPPKGAYERRVESEMSRLTYHGDGAWTQESFHENGQPAWVLPMRNHVYHGAASCLCADGTKAVEASYEKGRLHGQVTRFTEDGKVHDRTVFKNGRPQR